MSDFGIEKPNPVARKVVDLIGPVIEDLGYELVEVQFNREQHGQVLRVVIFQESGIGVDDCATVSREIGRILEVEDPIEQAYNLEVTSPGLDWRMRNVSDFVRFKGKKVRIVLFDEPEAIVGLIGQADENEVAIDAEGQIRMVPFTSIKKAKLVIEF